MKLNHNGRSLVLKFRGTVVNSKGELMNTSSKTVLKISLALNLIVVVLDTIGIVQGLGRPGQSMFLFYTEDSNILSLAACACFSVCTILILSGRLSEMPRWAQILKYMAACCLTLTFLVVVCVLAPFGAWVAYRRGQEPLAWAAMALPLAWLTLLIAVLQFGPG